MVDRGRWDRSEAELVDRWRAICAVRWEEILAVEEEEEDEGETEERGAAVLRISAGEAAAVAEMAECPASVCKREDGEDGGGGARRPIAPQ